MLIIMAMIVMTVMMIKLLIIFVYSGIGEECPKSTEYCFLETGQPDSINDEKWAELCEVTIMMRMMLMVTKTIVMNTKLLSSKSSFHLKQHRHQNQPTCFKRMPGAKRAVAFARNGISA